MTAIAREPPGLNPTASIVSPAASGTASRRSELVASSISASEPAFQLSAVVPAGPISTDEPLGIAP